jgi:hypothetical protein
VHSMSSARSASGHSSDPAESLAESIFPETSIQWLPGPLVAGQRLREVCSIAKLDIETPVIRGLSENGVLLVGVAIIQVG